MMSNKYSVCKLSCGRHQHNIRNQNYRQIFKDELVEKIKLLNTDFQTGDYACNLCLTNKIYRVSPSLNSGEPAQNAEHELLVRIVQNSITFY